MKKCKKAKEDPYLGLLNLRNTPEEGMQTSSVQHLLGRRTETSLPTIAERLMPSTPAVEKDKRKMEDKRYTVAERYVNRKSLKTLHVGDVVRMQPIQNRKDEWKQGIVSKKLKSRSYEVRTGDGKSYRRNRKFLRASVESRKEPMSDSSTFMFNEGNSASERSFFCNNSVTGRPWKNRLNWIPDPAPATSRDHGIKKSPLPEEEENHLPASHPSRVPRKIRPRRRKRTHQKQHLPGTNEN